MPHCTPDGRLYEAAYGQAPSRVGWQRTQVGEDPDRWLYVGVDGSARPQEVVTVAGDDGAKWYYPKEGRMSHEITDRVPGLTDQQVADLVQEAEAGYDLAPHQAAPAPHFQRVQVVPEDLLEAIDERAARDGQSPDAVVREALSNYLDTALTCPDPLA